MKLLSGLRDREVARSGRGCAMPMIPTGKTEEVLAMAFKGLEGKVAIVTGGGQGIGRAYAHRFAQEGCSVVVAEINAEKGKAVAGDIQSAGGKSMFVAADVSNEASCQAMAQAASDKFGRI